MFYPFTIDPYYFILIVPALLLGMWAQVKVNRTYNRYSHIPANCGYTGQQVARQILDQNELFHVQIECTAGRLTDRYDPRAGVVYLSNGVYDSTSIAAVGIAAHECGHAVQHANHYLPLHIRNAIIPVTNIGSKLAIPLIVAGMLFSYSPLVMVGLVGYSLIALFQLITLPVEFNASSRALSAISSAHIWGDEEQPGARKILSAAALTYVAALVASLAQLLRLLLLFSGRNRERQ